MVHDALHRIELASLDILFIENVGNLVCPAGFDLGESSKVVIASVTEGEDKPLKYPGMFAACGVMLVSKCDLLPVLRFDASELEANARRVNHDIEILQISAETPGGLEPWLTWLTAARDRRKSAA
jgi:hydrogenase nickel incorporation protein HypB